MELQAETMQKICKAISDISAALTDGLEAVQQALAPLLHDVVGIIEDLVPIVADIIKETMKTKPPRLPVRCIGSKMAGYQYKRRPHIRSGCRNR